MSYIRTKLSFIDKEILGEIYDELENITIPTTYRSGKKGGNFHAIKTGVKSQRNARQTVFGVTTYKGKKTKSKSSKDYPYMMDLLKDFMDSHKPDFKFKSVYVNRNTVCKKHLDSANAGESLLVGFGKYTGGQTVLYMSSGKEKKFHIKSSSLLFNGSEIQHKSEPFNGTRYSLVFFNS
jgi:hypothetical protein